MTAELDQASAALDCAARVVQRGVATLAETGVDESQVLAYDVAHAAAAVATARAAVDYGHHGETEARLACALVADVVAGIRAGIAGRSRSWRAGGELLDPADDFVALHHDPETLAALCGEEGPRHLPEELELARETFHRFAEKEIRPHAEHVHRTNADIPEAIIAGLAALGGFGLSVPQEYGGFATGSEGDYMGMVVATEELSWGSLGIGGSLITRPEIVTRALVRGGTEEQKRRWLPRLASGELLAAIAVTEPDYGSDVAGIVTTASRADSGWVLNGVKTWCTFAARADALMLLARTDPDRSTGHRGLSLFVVDKEPATGKGFLLRQDGSGGSDGSGPKDGSGGSGGSGPSDGKNERGERGGKNGRGGKLEGRPIDTLGYRGMHSYELALENWFVPDEGLVGGEGGLGKGFYFQMQGFENGRLQTAARALGVMQAAYEAAFAYARERKAFGRPIIDFQLTRAKLARMAVLIQGARQFSYVVARSMARGEGTLDASMAKAYACKAAEWVTREAMQIHGGMGYAEEYAVSRYFVDARVLSIFEGADETLALKVIARRLVEGLD